MAFADTLGAVCAFLNLPPRCRHSDDLLVDQPVARRA